MRQGETRSSRHPSESRSQTRDDVLDAKAKEHEIEDLPTGFAGSPSEDFFWWKLAYASRHRWKSRAHPWKRISKLQPLVFHTTAISDWLLFSCVLSGVLAAHFALLRCASSRLLHTAALVLWFCVALLYGSVIFQRMGNKFGTDWMMGYLLEVIFSLENVFIFQFIVKAFDAPEQVNRKCLLLVACEQIMFQLLLFMGASGVLKRLIVLPILLGILLVGMGFQTLMSGWKQWSERVEIDVVEAGAPGSSSDTFQAVVVTCESYPNMIAKHALGDRLISCYDDEEFSLWAYSGNKAAVTIILVQLVCLTIADFALEIDVTLTKIEEIDDQFVSFTSSALAAMVVPDLFFVAKDLLSRFFALRYGIAFVLIFFGGQMLLSQIPIFIPASASCGVLVAVVIISITVSAILDPRSSCGAEDSPGAGDEEPVALGDTRPSECARLAGEAS